MHPHLIHINLLDTFMKTLTTLLFTSITFANTAIAGGGSATIPSWLSTSSTNTHFYISNISGTPSTVKVKLYQQDGTVYNENSQSGQNFVFYGSFEGNPLSDTGAELDANKSGAIYMEAPAFMFGYGVIEWSSQSNKQISIIATGLNEYNVSGAYGKTMIEINDNKAF